MAITDGMTPETPFRIVPSAGRLLAAPADMWDGVCVRKPGNIFRNAADVGGIQLARPGGRVAKSRRRVHYGVPQADPVPAPDLCASARGFE